MGEMIQHARFDSTLQPVGHRPRPSIAPTSCVFIAAWLVSFGVASCGAPSVQATPAADVVRVYGAWSYCEPSAAVSLSRENAEVLQSEALRARSGTPYDLLIVPGFTPANAEKPLSRVDPVAAARLDEAVALYHEGKSHLVFVSGGNVRPANTTSPDHIGTSVRTHARHLGHRVGVASR